MISLREYLLTRPQELTAEEQNILYKNYILEYFGTYENWLFNTEENGFNEQYEETYVNNVRILKPNDHLLYEEGLIDVPKYFYWQQKLYEKLSESIKSDDPLSLRLLGNIPEIEQVEILNYYLIQITANDRFDVNNAEFKSFLNFSNYSVQSDNKENDKHIVQIEANIPKEIQYDCKYVYHVTTEFGYEKIMKQGLIPKSKSKLVSFDLRTYLWLENTNTYNIESFGRMMIRLYNLLNIGDNTKHNHYNKIDVNDFVVLRIDIEQMNKDNNKKMKLFGDPSANKFAVFTLEPIQSRYIERINIKDIKDETK